MDSPVPTPEGDLRSQLVNALLDRFPALDGFEDLDVLGETMGEVAEPKLARLRDERDRARRDFREMGSERDEKQMEIERLRRLVERQRTGFAEAIYCATDLPWDEVIVEARRVASDWLKRGAELDERRAEVRSMIRDLHAAQFDGSTSLPDRPLDTVWNWLLDLVGKDRSRLSGGNTTPTDAATEGLRDLVKDFRERAEQTVVALDDGGHHVDECDSPAECHAAATHWTWKLAARALEKALAAPVGDTDTLSSEAREDAEDRTTADALRPADGAS